MSRPLEIVFRGSHRCRQVEAGELHLRPATEKFGSASAMARLVWKHGCKGLLQGEGPLHTVVVQDAPTFDDMLAVLFVEELQAGRPLLGGARVLAQAAADLRQGVRPWPAAIPLENTLDGIFATIRKNAGDDLTMPDCADRMLAGWERLAEVLRPLLAAPALLPWDKLLPADQFASERAFLAEEESIYQRDVAGGERWMIGPPGYMGAIPGLLLHEPVSSLFDVCARCDRSAPGNKGYLFLAVSWGKGTWIFSTNPVHRIAIDSLAEALQAAEIQRNPNAAADPWYDGRRHNFTLVSSPWRGTRLSDEEVVAVVRKWGSVQAVSPRVVEPAIPSQPHREEVRTGIGRSLLGSLWSSWSARIASAALLLVAVLCLAAPERHPGPPPVARAETIFPPTVIQDLETQKSRGTEFSDFDTFTLPPGKCTEVNFTLDNPNERPQPIKLKLTLPSARSLPFRALQVKLAGSSPTTIELSPAIGNGRTVRGFHSQFHKFMLPAGKTTLTVQMGNPGTRSPEPAQQPLSLCWQFNPDPVNLHVMTVGVGKYAHPDGFKNLAAPPLDALALKDAFIKLQGQVFDQVVACAPLTDPQATKAAIIDQLGEFGQKVRADKALKLAVVHLAGHGKRVDKRYFVFMPHDYDDRKESTHLYWDELKPRLERLGCPVLVLLDACHSGQAGVQLAGRGGEDKPDEYLREFPTQRGLAVLAASQPEEQAFEARQGLLTQAVLEVLQGSARGVPGEGKVISLKDLEEYVRARVGKLSGSAGRQQRPMLRVDSTILPENIPITFRSAR